jgi:hypothetical protein
MLLWASIPRPIKPFRLSFLPLLLVNGRTIEASGRHAVLHTIGTWVRYLYFLRFSFLLWLSPVVLISLNTTGARTLTSGIVTPEYLGQYICVSFFLVTTGFVALIIARVVVNNGGERFGTDPTDGPKHLLANDNGRLEWLAVLVSQIPNTAVYVYFWLNGIYEHVDRLNIWSGLLIGTALAFVVWGVINATFYLTYTMPAVPAGTLLQLGTNAARTILFPRRWFGLANPGPGVPVDRTTLEGAQTPLTHGWINNFLMALTNFFGGQPGTQGYVFPGKGFYEGHAFSTLAIFGFLCLYVAVCPMTAPVPLVGWSIGFFLV